MPDVLSDGDSVYFLDSLGYLKKLREANFFSKAYILNQAKAIGTCNKEIQSQKWDANSELDFDGCEFTTFDQWVGGQGEDIDGFKIVSVLEDTHSNKSPIVTVETLIGGKKFVVILVRVVKEDEDYKIDDIIIK